MIVAFLTAIYVSGTSLRSSFSSTCVANEDSNLLCLMKFILLAIYRVTLHPLANYPGDLIDKITNWRLIYYCYSGNRHLRIFEGHKKYGMQIYDISPSRNVKLG